ncbi:hypothetical protein CRG98_013792 [Punica granatum]|uniref:Uncharacterized protein n=1 Tax=Punica granatum TaxID=22663 RepID=A0A2I0KBA9_PUNGR|nr:hypothetical protein CRG98_013792 [Punica granatum]
MRHFRETTTLVKSVSPSGVGAHQRGPHLGMKSSTKSEGTNNYIQGVDLSMSPLTPKIELENKINLGRAFGILSAASILRDQVSWLGFTLGYNLTKEVFGNPKKRKE